LNLTIPLPFTSPAVVTASGINPVCAGTGQALYQSGAVLQSITWFGTNLPSSGAVGLLKPNPASLGGLGPGTYFGRAFFPFFNSSYCYDTNSISLTGATTQLTSIFTTINATCFGQNTGKAFVTPSGGISPYNVTWTGGPVIVAPGQNATNLVAGSYNYTVIDSAGCKIGPILVTIGQPSQIVVSALSSVKPTCFGRQDGSLTFGVSGGVGGYTVSWLDYDTDLNPICCLSRNYLGAGTYRLQVTDSNGCKASGVGVVPAYDGSLPCLRARRNNPPCNDRTTCPVTVA